MAAQVILVFHIVVLGYWLGSELVINSTFRYVSWSASMPFAERNRLMDHVMDVDQHVRYALVMQAGSGVALAALYGLVPGAAGLAWVAAGLALAWLVLVEITHRGRAKSWGNKLAAFDRAIRYLVILAILGVALASALEAFTLPAWLVWKLVCFAGVISCGLGIRFALMSFYRIWIEIERDGSNDHRESLIRQAYVQATSVLLGLWVFIVIILVLSIWKPI